MCGVGWSGNTNTRPILVSIQSKLGLAWTGRAETKSRVPYPFRHSPTKQSKVKTMLAISIKSLRRKKQTVKITCQLKPMKLGQQAVENEVEVEFEFEDET